MTSQFAESASWQAWDRFVETTPVSGFMQSSAWVRFRAPIGYDFFGVTLKDGDAIIGGSVVAKWRYAPQRCFYYMQDGPVLPSAEADAKQVYDAILARVEQHRQNDAQTVSHLRIEPRWEHCPSFVTGMHIADVRDPYMEPRNTLCVDLRVPEEAILAQMKPKGRYNIRVAQRHAVTIVQDTSTQGITDFIRIQRRTAERQDMSIRPPTYFRDLIAAMLPDRKLSLFFAEYRGRRIAAALVVYFGKRATYFFGGSLVLYRSTMAPYLLHFEIMRSARAAGYECYDFWGIGPADQPDHPWAGFSEFKRKFGGYEERLVPTLDLVYDQATYDQYVANEGYATRNFEHWTTPSHELRA
jgi:lipid II:glycine glycyltransferase (peptidoglycan interpeptide bridge formation enzyme)